MTEATSYNTARTATVIIATIMVGVVVWWLRAILAPFALALFLMVIIDGMARVLKHRIPGFPEGAALPLALILTMLVFGLMAYLGADNAGRFMGQLIADSPKINGLIANIGGKFGMQVPPTVSDLVGQIDFPRNLTTIANGLKDVASGAAFVFVYLIFLFFSRHGFEEKVQLLYKNQQSRDNAVKIFIRIRRGVERYVWVQTLTGLIIGGLSWVMMMSVGLDNALFWAVLIFFAVYVPILGGAVAILLPAVFALVQFGTYWQAVTLLLVGQTIHFAVGNLVAPRIQGVTLNVDPIVVLLSLAFWGAIWGLTGMFLSTPLTVVAIVVLVQFPGTKWISILLSGDGNPEAYSDGPPDPSQPVPRTPPPRRRAPRNISVKS
jgi:AI-2 transport protein TqsA